MRWAMMIMGRCGGSNLAWIWPIGCVWWFSLLSSLRVPHNEAAIVVSRDNVGRVGAPDHRLQLLLAHKGGKTAGG